MLEIQLINQRDEKAWNEMIDNYYSPLFVFVNRIVRNKNDAEEIVNDCFVKVYENNNYQFDAIQQLSSFLFKTAKNAAINFLKKNAKENENSLLYAQLQDTSEDLAAEEEQEIDRLNRVNRIYDEINKHPPKRREAFELLYIRDKTAKEIAAIMGIHISNVYDYSNKLLNDLRKKFGPNVDKLFKRPGRTY